MKKEKLIKNLILTNFPDCIHVRRAFLLWAPAGARGGRVGRGGYFSGARVPLWVRVGWAEPWHRQNQVGVSPDHRVPPGSPVWNHTGCWGQNQGFCWALLRLSGFPTAVTPFPCKLLPSPLAPLPWGARESGTKTTAGAEAQERPQVSPLGFALGFGSGAPLAEIPCGKSQNVYEPGSVYGGGGADSQVAWDTVHTSGSSQARGTVSQQMQMDEAEKRCRAKAERALAARCGQ